MTADDYASFIREPPSDELRLPELYVLAQDAIGPGQPLLALVRRLVAEGRADDLEELHRGESPLHELLECGDSGVPDLAGLTPVAPIRADEAAAAGALRALAGLGLILVDDRPGEDELRIALDWYGEIARTCAAPADTAGAGPVRRGRAAERTPGPVARRLRQLDGIAASAGAIGPVVACAGLLRHLAPSPAGGKARAAGARRRLTGVLRLDRVPSVQVVFSHDSKEEPAGLRMRRRTGPDALVPNPEHMAFFCGDAEFGNALQHAWRAAARPGVGTVLWSLESTAGAPSRVDGGSLGCALAVVLDEVARRRPWWTAPIRLRRLRRKTTITGALDGDGGVVPVSGYADKLKAMEETQRLIVPSADVSEAERYAPADGMEIKGAADWKGAADLARRLSIRAMVWRATVIAVAVVMGVLLWLLGFSRHDADQQRRANAIADLATKSSYVDAVDPSLPPLLALAAYRLDPDSRVAAEALYRIAQNNAFVARTIQTHHGAVTALAQVDQGHVLYAATRNGGLSAWDLASGHRIAERPLTGRDITAVEVSGAAPEVLTADSRGGVELWRTDTAQRLAEPAFLAEDGPPGAPVGTSETDPVIGVGFAGADRAWALSGDGELRVWDTVTRAPLLTRTADETLGGANPAAFVAVTSGDVLWSNDRLHGSLLAATSTGRILAIDVATGRTGDFLNVPGLGSSITALALRPGSPDGIIAVGTENGMQLWDAHARRQLPSDGDGPEGVTALKFNSTGESLAIGTSEGTRMVSVPLGWDQVRRAPLSRPTGGQVSVFSSGADPEGLLPVGHSDGSITFLDPQNRRVTQPEAPGSTIAAFDASGRLLVTDLLRSNNWTTGLRVIEPAEGHVYDPVTRETDYRKIFQLKPAPEWWPEEQLFFAQDAALTDDFAIVAGQVWRDHAYRGMVAVWDARTGNPLHAFFSPGDRADRYRSVRYVPALKAIVARGDDGDVHAWSTRTWREMLDASPGPGRPLGTPPGEAAAVAPVTGDGDRDGQARSLAYIDLKSHQTRVVPLKYAISALAFAPEGGFAAVLSTDNRIHFLNGDGSPRKSQPSITLRASAAGLAIDRAGRRIAVAMSDGDILVYDIATRTLAIPPLRDQNGALPADPAWSDDGDLLVTIGYREAQRRAQVDGVQFWHTRKLSWPQQMCALAGRDIRESEWKQYVHGGFEFRPLCPGEG